MATTSIFMPGIDASIVAFTFPEAIAHAIRDGNTPMADAFPHYFKLLTDEHCWDKPLPWQAMLCPAHETLRVVSPDGPWYEGTFHAEPEWLAMATAERMIILLTGDFASPDEMRPLGKIAPLYTALIPFTMVTHED
jgi:hypothetical protein